MGMKESAEKQRKRHPDVFAGGVWGANEVHIRGSRGRIQDLHSNNKSIGHFEFGLALFSNRSVDRPPNRELESLTNVIDLFVKDR